MGIRELAERDLGVILNARSSGFGWPITITDPDGVRSTLTGFSNDISQAVDPETGMMVSGRSASCALRISDLALAGLSVPRAVADTGGKPWVIEFADINGNACAFKIRDVSPDRALGLVVCVLEDYRR